MTTSLPSDSDYRTKIFNNRKTSIIIRVAMFEQYEINSHLLAGAVAVLVAAGAIFMVFSNIQLLTMNAAAKPFDEAACRAALAQYVPWVGGAQLTEYVIDKHIDRSNGTNVVWRIGFAGNKVGNLTLVDSIPLYERTAFFVSSSVFEGCGTRITGEPAGTAAHWICSRPEVEFFLESGVDGNYTSYKLFTKLKAGSFAASMTIVRNEYYQKIDEEFQKVLKTYGCNRV